MSKEMGEYALEPLLYELNELYTKYKQFCSVKFDDDESEICYYKTNKLTASALFKLLDSDFQNVFREANKLDRMLKS